MADVVGLYPSIPHEAGLKALRKVLVKREKHTLPSSELIRMTDFVLTDKLSNKFLVPLLVPCLPYLTCVYLWIKLKLLFLKPKNYSLWCSLDILTTFFYLETWGARTLNLFA